MSKQLFLPVSLTSALWRLSRANPVDPTITPAAVLPRQGNPDNLLGWLFTDSTWINSTCNSDYTYSVMGDYAACCHISDTSCNLPISCSQGSQVYTFSELSTTQAFACTDNQEDPQLSICNTIFIYENTQDSNPKRNIGCGNMNWNWSYYRSIDSSLTEIVTSSSTSSQPGTFTSSLSGIPTSSSPETSSTTPDAPIHTPEPEPGSKAWIAGAVAGPILGLALIGAGVWLFLRRKKTAATAHMDPSQPPAGVGGYTDAKPQYQPAQHAYPSPAQNQAYPQQGGFSPPQISPAPQYGFSPPYNNTPSPSMGTYAHDAKYEVNREAEAAELGGSSTIVREAAPPAQGRR